MALAMTASARLSQWAKELTLEAIPSDVRRTAALHLLDGVGCAIAGSDEPAARAAVAVAALATAPEEATIIGFDRRGPAPAAALANGALVHALDFDDTHAGGLVHATAAVLPAALAVGEEVAASGAEILTAAVAGYEAVCGLAAAVPHGFHERGFHATSVCGVFAAALVASRLYGQSADVTAHALGIAGSSAAGSLEFLRSPATTKQLHPGLAAQAGITAARLARAGATGPATIFEGEHGLFRSYLGTGIEPGELFAGLGREWQTSSINLKPFPACQLSHATLHAAATARPQLPVGWAERVTGIVIWLPEESVPIVAGPAAAKRRPASPYEAKFSVQWSTAAMLVDGVVAPATFAYDRLERADMLALADIIEVRADKVDGVAADAPGRLRIELAGSDAVEVEVPAHHGVSAELAEQKFRANGGTKETSSALLAIEDLGPGEITAALAGVAPHQEGE
jgi:2-methylcitrate dehydratase PrpD